MRKLIASALSASAIAVGMIGITATPAAATVAVGCNDTSGYLIIHNERRHCFAYAGDLGVYIDNVYWIQSGNNLIDITYRTGPSGVDQYLSMHKFKDHHFDRRVIVTHIHIV
jgi:hypothetical protein